MTAWETTITTTPILERLAPGWGDPPHRRSNLNLRLATAGGGDALFCDALGSWLGRCHHLRHVELHLQATEFLRDDPNRSVASLCEALAGLPRLSRIVLDVGYNGITDLVPAVAALRRSPRLQTLRLGLHRLLPQLSDAPLPGTTLCVSGVPFESVDALVGLGRPPLQRLDIAAAGGGCGTVPSQKATRLAQGFARVQRSCIVKLAL